MHCTRRNGPHVISPGVVKKPVEREKTLYLQLCRKGRNPLRGVFEQPMERVRPAVRSSNPRPSAVNAVAVLGGLCAFARDFPPLHRACPELAEGMDRGEATGRRGEASPCFPGRPGDWPEGFIPGRRMACRLKPFKNRPSGKFPLRNALGH